MMIAYLGCAFGEHSPVHWGYGHLPIGLDMPRSKTFDWFFSNRMKGCQSLVASCWNATPITSPSKFATNMASEDKRDSLIASEAFRGLQLFSAWRVGSVKQIVTSCIETCRCCSKAQDHLSS